MGKKGRVFVIFLGLFALLIIFVTVARAASTGAVTATVTAKNVSLTVTDGSVAFGTIGVGATANTTSTGVNDSQTATNNGNVEEDFNIRAADSTNWTLAATAGSEQYTMKSCVTNCDTTPTWTGVGISPSYVSLSTNVATSGTTVFDLLVGAPTSTTSYGQQTITVTVQAVDST